MTGTHDQAVGRHPNEFLIEPSSKVYWLVACGFWSLCSLPGISHYLFQHESIKLPAGYFVFEEILPLYLWIPLSSPTLRASARWPLFQWNPRFIAFHIALASGLILCHSVFLLLMQFLLGYQHIRQADWYHWGEHIFYPFSTSAVLYGPLLLTGTALALYSRFRRQEIEAANLQLASSRLESQLTSARLQALGLQLRPHFLFNALNAVSALVESEPAKARQMIAQLSELLRLTLEKTDRPMVSLSDEMKLLRHYVEVERARFGDRLEVEISLMPQALDVAVPTLILQPLVENAIRHGMSEVGLYTVQVDAEIVDQRLCLRVTNSVPATTKKSAPGLGIGLSNTRRRLRRHYGERCRFEVLESAASSFCVEMHLPLSDHPGGPEVTS